MHATIAMEGVLDVNEVITHMIEFAALPVEERHDFEHEDDDAIAYKLQGMPEGTEAHFLVGMVPYQENGRSFRYLQLQINIDSGEPEYLQGSMRRGPAISLSISYDETDKKTATRFALLLTRPVDFSASRESGINAYQGRFTTGAMFGIDMLNNPYNPTVTTVGMVNGSFMSGPAFGGVSPLGGDTHLNPDLLERLHELLQENLSTLRNE